MEKPTVPNKVIDSDTRGELWFMAYQKLSDSQVLLLLKIYLGMGKKFPHAQVLKVDTRDLGFVSSRLTAPANVRAPVAMTSNGNRVEPHYHSRREVPE